MQRVSGESDVRQVWRRKNATNEAEVRAVRNEEAKREK